MTGPTAPPLLRASPSRLLNLFIPPALAMLVAAAIALVLTLVGVGGQAHWLTLHLALLGGVSQLILGVGQFFVCSYLATTPPTDRLLFAQLGSFNLGVVLLAAGRLVATPQLAEAGAALIVLALALFTLAVGQMRARSLRRADLTILWYLAGAASLALGVAIGALLVRGTAWSHGSLLGAHLALNLGGWIGAAIIGTLHTFYPTLTGTQLPRPRLEPPTLALWMFGVWALAGALAWSLGWLATLALASLALATVSLLVNLATALLRRKIPLTHAAKLVTAGQVLLAAALLAAPFAIEAAGGGVAFDWPAGGLLAACVLGWIACTVAGSLIHLIGVMRHLRRLRRLRPGR